MSKSPRKHSLTYEIALTASLLKSAMQKRFREEGVHITPQQLAVLALLEKQPEGVTMHFISEQTFRDKSATTRIVDTLEIVPIY